MVIGVAAQQLDQREFGVAGPGVVQGDVGRRSGAGGSGRGAGDQGAELGEGAVGPGQRRGQGAGEGGQDGLGVLSGDRDGLGRRALADGPTLELHIDHHVLDGLGAPGRGHERAQQAGPVAVRTHRHHARAVLWIQCRAHSIDITWAAARPIQVPMKEPIRAYSTPTGTS